MTERALNYVVALVLASALAYGIRYHMDQIGAAVHRTLAPVVQR